MSNRNAPYQHKDGTNCWTKNCRTNKSFAPTSEQEARFQEASQHVTGAVSELEATTFKYELAKEKFWALVSLVNEKTAELAKFYVPRDVDEAHGSYYEATDKKHFGDKTEPGSKFLYEQLNSVEDVVTLRMIQKQSSDLSGDDKEALIAKGSDPNGFSEGKRYLMVNTFGTVGIKNSADFPDNHMVDVVRTKPGSPCSLVTTVDDQPKTDYAVIVVGQHKQLERDFVITTFPGPVTKPTSNAELDAKEGTSMTIAEVKSILGDNFWINTKLKV